MERRGEVRRGEEQGLGGIIYLGRRHQSPGVNSGQTASATPAASLIASTVGVGLVSQVASLLSTHISCSDVRHDVSRSVAPLVAVFHT